MLYTEQLAAFNNIKDFLSDPSSQVFILKGYAGAGKTTLIKHVCDFLAAIEVPFLLTAPTGRAARILSDKTKLSARTIHSTILICNSTFHITNSPVQYLIK
jgi:tRNA A37 threonylcarbamoyladenosine biosynthesis protein TsaE